MQKTWMLQETFFDRFSFFSLRRLFEYFLIWRIVSLKVPRTFPCHTSVWWCLVCDFLGVKKTKPSISGQMEKYFTFTWSSLKNSRGFPFQQATKLGAQAVWMSRAFLLCSGRLFRKEEWIFWKGEHIKVSPGEWGFRKKALSSYLFIWSVYPHLP